MSPVSKRVVAPKGSGGVATPTSPSRARPAARGSGAATRPGSADGADDTAAAEAGLELYFLRHADAGDPAEWTGDDADRPLSKKGRRQAKRLGRLLDGLRFQPDALLTSPKLRSVDTARIVGRAIGVKAGTNERLAGGLDATGLGDLIAGLDGAVRRVMLVGHDPEFSTLVSWLVGAPISLRKGALARTDLPGRSVGPGAGALSWLLPPDAVPG